MGKRGPHKNAELDRWIGSRIYRQRQRRGLTLQVLADRAGVHVNTLNNVENGAGIAVSSLCRIAVALRIGLDALVPLTQTLVKPPKETLPSEERVCMIPFGTEKLFEDSGPVAETGEHYESGPQHR